MTPDDCFTLVCAAARRLAYMPALRGSAVEKPLDEVALHDAVVRSDAYLV